MVLQKLAVSLKMKFCVLISFIIISDLIPTVTGNGAMYDPPGRNVMWKYRFPVEKNYNYMQLHCGGILQEEFGEKKCGVCGDPPTGPKDHEVGGKYGSRIISRYYPEGTKEMVVKVELITYEKGFFEFRICKANNNRVTQKCLDDTQLPIKEGYLEGTPLRFYPKTAGDFHLTVALPPKLTCDRCVLQWRYRTGVNWGTDPATGREGMGIGPQEEFYNCADIRIGGLAPEALRQNVYFAPPDPQENVVVIEKPTVQRKNLVNENTGQDAFPKETVVKPAGALETSDSTIHQLDAGTRATDSTAISPSTEIGLLEKSVGITKGLEVKKPNVAIGADHRETLGFDNLAIKDGAQMEAAQLSMERQQFGSQDAAQMETARFNIERQQFESQDAAQMEAAQLNTGGQLLGSKGAVQMEAAQLSLERQQLKSQKLLDKHIEAPATKAKADIETSIPKLEIIKANVIDIAANSIDRQIPLDDITSFTSGADIMANQAQLDTLSSKKLLTGRDVITNLQQSMQQVAVQDSNQLVSDKLQAGTIATHEEITGIKAIESKSKFIGKEDRGVEPVSDVSVEKQPFDSNTNKPFSAESVNDIGLLSSKDQPLEGIQTADSVYRPINSGPLHPDEKNEKRNHNKTKKTEKTIQQVTTKNITLPNGHNVVETKTKTVEVKVTETTNVSAEKNGVTNTDSTGKATGSEVQLLDDNYAAAKQDILQKSSADGSTLVDIVTDVAAVDHSPGHTSDRALIDVEYTIPETTQDKSGFVSALPEKAVEKVGSVPALPKEAVEKSSSVPALPEKAIEKTSSVPSFPEISLEKIEPVPALPEAALDKTGSAPVDKTTSGFDVIVENALNGILQGSAKSAGTSSDRLSFRAPAIQTDAIAPGMTSNVDQGIIDSPSVNSAVNKGLAQLAKVTEDKTAETIKKGGMSRTSKKAKINISHNNSKKTVSEIDLSATQPEKKQPDVAFIIVGHDAQGPKSVLKGLTQSLDQVKQSEPTALESQTRKAVSKTTGQTDLKRALAADVSAVGIGKSAPVERMISQKQTDSLPIDTTTSLHVDSRRTSDTAPSKSSARGNIATSERTRGTPQRVLPQSTPVGRTITRSVSGPSESSQTIARARSFIGDDGTAESREVPRQTDSRRRGSFRQQTSLPMFPSGLTRGVRVGPTSGEITPQMRVEFERRRRGQSRVLAGSRSVESLPGVGSPPAAPGGFLDTRSGRIIVDGRRPQFFPASGFDDDSRRRIGFAGMIGDPRTGGRYQFTSGGIASAPVAPYLDATGRTVDSRALLGSRRAMVSGRQRAGGRMRDDRDIFVLDPDTRRPAITSGRQTDRGFRDDFRVAARRPVRLDGDARRRPQSVRQTMTQPESRIERPVLRRPAAAATVDSAVRGIRPLASTPTIGDFERGTMLTERTRPSIMGSAIPRTRVETRMGALSDSRAGQTRVMTRPAGRTVAAATAADAMRFRSARLRGDASTTDIDRRIRLGRLRAGERLGPSVSVGRSRYIPISVPVRADGRIVPAGARMVMPSVPYSGMPMLRPMFGAGSGPMYTFPGSSSYPRSYPTFPYTPIGPML